MASFEIGIPETGILAGILTGRASGAPAQPENPMTPESREVTIVDPGAAVEAVFDRDQAESPDLKPEDLCMAAAQ